MRCKPENCKKVGLFITEQKMLEYKGPLAFYLADQAPSYCEDAQDEVVQLIRLGRKIPETPNVCKTCNTLCLQNKYKKWPKSQCSIYSRF